MYMYSISAVINVQLAGLIMKLGRSTLLSLFILLLFGSQLLDGTGDPGALAQEAPRHSYHGGQGVLVSADPVPEGTGRRSHGGGVECSR